MDLRTGKTYTTEEAALADGVLESDLVHITERRTKSGKVTPRLKFRKGPFRAIRNLEPEKTR